jgi:hypothetical protein
LLQIFASLCFACYALAPPTKKAGFLHCTAKFACGARAVFFFVFAKFACGARADTRACALLIFCLLGPFAAFFLYLFSGPAEPQIFFFVLKYKKKGGSASFAAKKKN